MKIKNAQSPNSWAWLQTARTRGGYTIATAFALVLVAVQGAPPRRSVQGQPLGPLVSPASGQIGEEATEPQSLNLGQPSGDTPNQAYLRSLPKDQMTPELRLLVAATFNGPLDLGPIVGDTELTEIERLDLEDLADSLELQRRLPHMAEADRLIAEKQYQTRSYAVRDRVVQIRREHEVERVRIEKAQAAASAAERDHELQRALSGRPPMPAAEGGK